METIPEITVGLLDMTLAALFAFDAEDAPVQNDDANRCDFLY